MKSAALIATASSFYMLFLLMVKMFLTTTGFGKPSSALTRAVHPGLIQGPVHMYRTLYQAGMYKTALKKCLLLCEGIEQWREA